MDGPQRKGLLVGWLSQEQPTPPRPSAQLSQQERLRLLISPELKQLAKYHIPPSLSKLDYPGRPRPFRNDLRHLITQIQRLFLLHAFACPPDPPFNKLVDLLDPDNPERQHIIRCEKGWVSSISFPDGVRLHGPKVVGVPGELSAGEYASLAPWMAWWCKGWWTEGEYAWLYIDQLARQAALCPELLDYAPE